MPQLCQESVARSPVLELTQRFTKELTAQAVQAVRCAERSGSGTRPSRGIGAVLRRFSVGVQGQLRASPRKFPGTSSRME